MSLFERRAPKDTLTFVKMRNNTELKDSFASNFSAVRVAF